MQSTTFRCYDLAVQFYKEARSSRLPAHLKNQFDRASSSIALNLNEGWARAGKKERTYFFRVAFGSIRECQAIADLESQAFNAKSRAALDTLAAATYRLLNS